MVNIKFIIDDRCKYEYLGDLCDLEKFFLQHKKIKQKKLYKINVYIKHNKAYFLSDIKNLYLYKTKYILLLEKKKNYRQCINLLIKEDCKYKITLESSPLLLYYILITDLAGYEKAYFYLLDTPVKYQQLIPKRYHIDYIYQIHNNSLYSIIVYITKAPVRSIWWRIWYKFKYKN